MTFRSASRFLLIVWVLLASACNRESPPPDAKTSGAEALARFDPASMARGAALFGHHCAQCHGPQAQGHPDWQTPSAGAFAAAPPLNGTGNDFKRSRAELAAVIRNGVRRKSDNADIMPAWNKRLNGRDIDDLLNWMQSLWPPDVYDNWHQSQVASAPGKPNSQPKP